MFHWLLWGIPICLQGISKRQSTDKRSFMKVSELQKAAMQSCWLWLRDAGVTSAKCCSTKRAQCRTLCKTFKNSQSRKTTTPSQDAKACQGSLFLALLFLLVITFSIVYFLKQAQLGFFNHQDSQCSITSIGPLCMALPKPGGIQRELFSGWETNSFFALLPAAQCTWRQQ